MGGNALKEFKPKRMTTREVTNTFNYIQRLWLLRYPDSPPYLVPWVDEKDDHGDIDIVVERYPEDVKEWLTEHTTIMKTNDRVISAGWPTPNGLVQVDFICEDSDTATARFFYSGGDFGMLMGRLAAWHGLVFGMDGLRLRADPEKPWSKDILLTRDPEVILETLGLQKKMPRFTTYKKMWDYVMASPMARSYMFMPAATNAENRSRDRQRPRIKEFQEWLKKYFPWDPVVPPDIPRVTFEKALETVAKTFGAFVINECQQQESRWKVERNFNQIVGVDAVAMMSAKPLGPEITGDVIRGMQPYLPTKPELKKLPPEIVMKFARAAARISLMERGLPVKS